MNNIFNKILKSLTTFCWSIGIFEGDSIDNLQPYENNPVLTKDDVTDCLAGFLADPFLFLHEDGRYYLFFEVMNVKNGKGEIGCAVSDDKYNWTYLGIIMKDKCHLSYPMIFEWDKSIFLIPESWQRKTVRLYKAVEFPYVWEHQFDLLEGEFYTDSTVFRLNNKWWMFTYVLDPWKNEDNAHLELWYSEHLEQSWKPHPGNPISYGKEIPSRPAGRIFIDEQLYRFAQNTAEYYGQELYKFVIDKISETEFRQIQDTKGPFFLGSRSGWNSHGMHHVDIIRGADNKYTACADGLSEIVIRNPHVLCYKVINRIKTNYTFRKR